MQPLVWRTTVARVPTALTALPSQIFLRPTIVQEVFIALKEAHDPSLVLPACLLIQPRLANVKFVCVDISACR